jgi:adenylate cyclase
MMRIVAGERDTSPPDDDDVQTLRALGISDEVIARAIERGDPEGAIFESVLMPAMAERTVTAAEIEQRGGLPAAQTRALIEAFGLRPPPPDQPDFTPEEARVFIELRRLGEVWSPELGIQLARVYGRLLGRIAHTELQLFRLYVEPRLRDGNSDRLAGMRALQAAFARLLPLADPLLVGVHRRWIEHELAAAAVSQAETEASPHVLPGAVNVALLFCDLKDFTAFADSEGDAAAVDAIDRFAETVVRERGDESRMTKSLGDGFFLAYGDASAAVAAGARIINGMRGERVPGVHAGVHQGVAIAREGDYFGSAVNLAARLLGAAGRDELLATRPVVERSTDRFGWQPAGVRRLRGVAEPVEVFRLLSEPVDDEER